MQTQSPATLYWHPLHVNVLTPNIVLSWKIKVFGLFVTETLSKPPWQQQQKHGQTKYSINTQIALFVCFKFLFHFLSILWNKATRKSAWDKNRNSDSKLFTFLFRTEPCSLFLWQTWCLVLLERLITSTIHLVDVFISIAILIS